MKTKPHTVRFDEKDFEFICKRENLKTAQSIINFLIGEYIKLYKVEEKSVFEIKREKSLEQQLPLSPFSTYLSRLRNCTMTKDIQSIMREVKNDDLLPPIKKISLEQEAKELSKDFFND